MARGVRSGVLAVSLAALLVAACSSQPVAPTPSPTPGLGGTLRVGISGFAGPPAELVYFDPAALGFDWLKSCCLARTLLTYPGRPTVDGGTVLQPDLAAGPPSVSRDGLTWTFRLRAGIRYAPPYEALEVTAADIIRAVERHARLSPETTDPNPYAPFGFLAGAADYATGAAPTISGLSSPEPHALVVRLSRPFGAFGVLVAQSAWAPIPEPLAEGHDDDLGRYWASTGPYMFETYPGDTEAEPIVLVRNPSWDRATDPRRGAWVDRIEFVGADDPRSVIEQVAAGGFDLGDWPVILDLIDRYRADPTIASRMRSTTDESIFWVPMNLAQPPFDDVAVRRAVNAVVDRAALRDLILAARSQDPRRGPQPPGRITGHVFPDSLTDGLLLTYAPWASPGDRGDLGRARAEMRGSRYDSDRDGLCDASACRGIRLPSEDAAAGERLRADLALLGIEAAVVPLDETTDMVFPANRTPIQVNLFAWGFNLTGSDLATTLRGGPDIVDEGGFALNMALVGASPEQLAEWGYDVRSVPSVDAMIDACDLESGHRRARCWAELDQHVTSVLVPWVPLFAFEMSWLTSPRVASFTIDQALPGTWVTLDQVSLRPGATP